MLQIENLEIRLDNVQILKNLSLTANKGEIIGLVAPNGSGKTTLLRAIVNLIIPKTGSIRVLNMKYEDNREEILKKIFFLQDNTSLYPFLSGDEHLKLVKKVWKSNVDLESTINKLNMESYINKKVLKYSLGMKQRLLFAMCLISECDLLLMDEPMNGLDPSNIKLVSNSIRALKEQGKTIIFSSHILPNVDDLCDRVIFLKNGHLVYESTKSEPNQAKYVEIAFDDTTGYKSLISQFEDKIVKKAGDRIIFSMEDSHLKNLLNFITQNNIKYSSLNIACMSSQLNYERLYEGSGGAHELN